MANITGVRTSENILQARRVVDMARDIALLEPNEAPFVTFLKRARKIAVLVITPNLNG